MSEDSKAPATTQAPAAPAVEEPKEAALVPAEEPKEEAVDGLLIEEDGDSFWVIQQVFWGIVKTALLLGLLLFLIWLVWRPTSFFSTEAEIDFVVEPTVAKTAQTQELEEAESEPGFWRQVFGLSSKQETPTSASDAEPKTPKKTTETVKDIAQTPKVAPSVSSNDSTGTDVAYDLEEDRTLLVRGILPEAVKWLREAKTVGEISMSMVREGSPASRSRQVEEILAAADGLFVRSVNLQSQLQNEITYFLEQGTAANTRTEELEADIALSLQQLDPVSVEPLVAQKVLSQQNASYYMSNARIRDTLLRNIQTFDRALRQQSIPLLNPATEIRAS